MKRRLFLLNVGIAALTAAAVWRWHQELLATKAREQATFRQAIKPVAPPPFSPLPEPQRVVPASYNDIAQKMLFSKDRNPAVVVEAAVVAPKPMPALPILHGVMNLGDGLTAILSEKKGAPHRDLRPGDEIGKFKLLAVNREDIVLEWEGKQVKKRLEELKEHVEPEPGRSQPAPAAAPVSLSASALAAPPPNTEAAPGIDMGNGVRACQPGDTSPAGTLKDGLRKVVSQSPFGQVCRWEPVK